MNENPSSPSPINSLPQEIQAFFAQRTWDVLGYTPKLVEFLSLAAKKIQSHPEIFAAKFGDFRGYELKESGGYIYFERFTVAISNPNDMGVQLIACPYLPGEVEYLDNPFSGKFLVKAGFDEEKYWGQIFIFHLDNNGEFSKQSDGSLGVISGFRAPPRKDIIHQPRRIRKPRTRRATAPA